MLPKCDCCKKAVKQNGEAALGCGYCQTWRHAKCCTPPIGPDMMLTLQKSNCLQFICNKCRDVKPADQSEPTPADNTNERLALAIERLNVTLTAIENRVTGIENRIESLSTAIPTRVQVVNLIEETVEQRENRSQLVVVGVPETDTDDDDYLSGLLTTIGAANCPPAEIFRMGQASNERRSPRPIKMRFSRRWQRDQVLEKAKSLKDSSVYPNVFIRPSYTAHEREMIGALYDQKKACEREGGVWYIRRRGPVSEWEVVRSERDHQPHHHDDGTGQWQTVQTRRRSQTDHPNVATTSSNNRSLFVSSQNKT